MNLLCAVRGIYGLAQLTAPGLVAQVFGVVPDRPVRLATRVLGARDLAQGAASVTAPTAAVLALGAEVDLLHSLSMIGVAVADQRRRRAALTSAAVAAGFSVAGVLATRRARRQPPAPAGHGSALQVRDRLARYLVPPQVRALDY